MSKEHGNLSINSQNIFPIIKKWMYSDHDIFYRELVSNACDAITKLKKLSMIGEYEAPDDIEYKVEIKLSAKDKAIKIIDNVIGMISNRNFRGLYQSANNRDCDTFRADLKGLHLSAQTIQSYFSLL